jgi:hypothetical protein
MGELNLRFIIIIIIVVVVVVIPDVDFLWVVTPCSGVVGYHHFGGTYSLHPEDGCRMVLRNVGIIPHH